MSEKDKQIIQSLKKSVNALPEDKREFLRGYAEGVAAMAAKQADTAQGMSMAPVPQDQADNVT